ncbi:hypothetical protein DL769_011700 [Monosporascus sp. CRB-8-3]|nr:hypothetical protein DL769_011700 [Monosporascus sp. CRB-8-3]
MGPDEEYLIAKSLEEVRRGERVEDSAAAWGTSATTVRRRRDGGLSMQEALEPYQRLSKDDERFVAEWICEEEDAGRAPNKAQVRRFAEVVLQSHGNEETLGIHWTDGFLHRNPDIKTKLARQLDSSRAKDTQEDALHRYHNALKRVILKKKIKPGRITNMDECGVQEGESRGGKVLGSALKGHAELKKSEGTNWASILEAATSAGESLTSLVIFKGITLQGQWFPDIIPPWKYDSSPSGWSNARIALRWLREVYLPETKPPKATDGRILLVDEHVTHESVQFQYECKINNVALIYLPPHSTHVSQPLDVGVFSPLKMAYRERTKGWQSYDTSAPRMKQRFLEAYAHAHGEAFTWKNIHSGFRHAGVWPLDVNKIVKNPRVVHPELDIPRPVTPMEGSPSKLRDELTFFTPKKSQDLKKQSKCFLFEDVGGKRSYRAFVGKAGKALDQDAEVITALKLENQLLREENESLKPIAKKKVKPSAEDSFANIQDIYRAQREAKQQQAKLVEDHKAQIALEKQDLLESAPAVLQHMRDPS